jgi:pSer/pThr/pTyr-binding forkhead associated (FHA) protein
MHGLVSREHCQLYIDRGRLFVRDLDSLNGSFVGGQRRAHPGVLAGSAPRSRSCCSSAAICAFK